MEDANVHESRPRGPRAYHKKSRTGCLPCKQRRVKCDELHPSCGTCSRHLVECVYQTPPSDASVFQSSHSSGFYPPPSSSNLTPHVDDVEYHIDIPEGPWRRMWELRLLHNSQTRMKQPFVEPQEPVIVQIWSEEVPRMAINFAQKQGRSSLLYIELAHSALHMWANSRDRQERDELIKLQKTYQLMCIKGQRRDINDIPHASPQLLDYICFTSLRIVAHSLALVQTLSLNPWEPPLQWLYMGHGAGFVFREARNEIRDEHSSLIGMFAHSPPSMIDPKDTILVDHSPLAWLLDHPSHHSSIEAQTDQELNDKGVRAVYEQALAYTCSVMRAKERKEPEMAIVRRLGAFAVWVPIEFSKFIEERRPRALVVLAHFMSLWVDLEHVWLLGRAGEWQMRCIYKILPMAWTCKLGELFAKLQHRRIHGNDGS